MAELYPIPDKDHGKALLTDVDRQHIHEIAWRRVQQEFPGVTVASRLFIKQHFAPEEQEAAFDGLTLGLFLLSGAKSTADLQTLFDAIDTQASQEQEPITVYKS